MQKHQPLVPPAPPGASPYGVQLTLTMTGLPLLWPWTELVLRDKDGHRSAAPTGLAPRLHHLLELGWGRAVLLCPRPRGP